MLAAGNERHLHRARERLERLLELLVPTRQVEEHLVGALFVLEGRRLIGLDEVQVEVARRLRG